MQLTNEIGQHNHEHVQTKGLFTIDLYGPTRPPITPGLVLLGALPLVEGKCAKHSPPGQRKIKTYKITINKNRNH